MNLFLIDSPDMHEYSGFEFSVSVFSFQCLACVQTFPPSLRKNPAISVTPFKIQKKGLFLYLSKPNYGRGITVAKRSKKIIIV